ncbi:MAG: hypothetical protein ACYTBJ_21970 [Planctomycetota bacterium]|jgi:hypothetical protein
MSLNPKTEYRKIVFVCLLLILIVWVGHVTGCTPASEGGAPNLPVLEPAPLSFNGQLEFADGSVVDLQTGLFLTGGEGKAVERVDFDLTGGVLADGSPQLMTVQYRSHKHGEWVRCGSVKVDVMQCAVTFTVPFHESCGAADIGVECRPFRLRAATPDAAPAD